MCSFVGVENMEHYQGDLTDILRGRGGGGTWTGSSSDHININWDLQFPSDPSNFTSSTAMDDHRESCIFGDPFSLIRDPLLHQLNFSYYSTPNSTATATRVEESAGFCQQQQKTVFEDDNIKSPCNIFSRIQISSSSQSPKLHISTCDSPVVMPAMFPSDIINASKATTSLLDKTAPVQISSPRNLGIKRRKSQAKKVVCIPAPAAANSRSSGEVVPSDLWAWRKYGQKPIKGSPYPRGYYRCSSSKGCSARKQVERSRIDPNMLVITYTSEHNHPWPTQRNALAGSTRSLQPSKHSANAASKNSPMEEEVKENSNYTTMSPHVGGASCSSASVKEEFEENINEEQFQIEDAAGHRHQLFSSGEGISQIYKPAAALPDDIHSNQSEDFFADLGELEADPLSLLFTTRGFSTSTGDEQKESKDLDAFSMFDWSAGDGTYNNNSSGESKSKGFITRP